MKIGPATVIAVIAAGGTASAAGRPSGLDVWLTCRNDVKVVCPNTGLFHLSALKLCMREKFSQLGPKCQSVVVRYQDGRPVLASRSDPLQ